MGRKKRNKKLFKPLEKQYKKELVLDMFYRMYVVGYCFKLNKHPIYEKLNFSDHRVRDEINQLTNELLKEGYLEIIMVEDVFYDHENEITKISKRGMKLIEELDSERLTQLVEKLSQKEQD